MLRPPMPRSGVMGEKFVEPPRVVVFFFTGLDASSVTSLFFGLINPRARRKIIRVMMILIRGDTQIYIGMNGPFVDFSVDMIMHPGYGTDHTHGNSSIHTISSERNSPILEALVVSNESLAARGPDDPVFFSVGRQVGHVARVQARGIGSQPYNII